MNELADSPRTRRSIDIVVPAYNEEACVAMLYERLRVVLEPLPYDFRVIFVDDGSRDGTAAECLRLAERDPRVGLLRFSRNFGHQAALTAGLDAADADAVITMDADLQHPPEMLPRFIEAWEKGAEVVSGVRARPARVSFAKRVSSALFYRVLNVISPYRITPDSPDFRLFDAKVVRAIRRIREQSRFLRGIYAWVGFEHVDVPYDEAEREAGRSSYGAGQMFLFALRAVLSFSVLPLRFATYFGMFVAVLSFMYGVYAIVMNVVYHRVIVGWTSLAALIAFLSGVQLVTLGVIGEYLGQVLEESKRRPLYIVADDRIPARAGAPAESRPSLPPRV